MPDGNAKPSGKVMWSRSQYAPRTCHGTLVVSCWLLVVGWGGADRTSRGRLAIRTGGGWLVGEDASSGTLFVKSPAMMATSFVESPLMESGGVFVEAGGFEPP